MAASKAAEATKGSFEKGAYLQKLYRPAPEKAIIALIFFAGRFFRCGWLSGSPGKHAAARPPGIMARCSHPGAFHFTFNFPILRK
jgi:hypothetical protein